MGAENYITRHRKKIRLCPFYDLAPAAIRKIFARNRVASASSRDEIVRLGKCPTGGKLHTALNN